jgi:DNA-binding NtrC family response regulator
MDSLTEASQATELRPLHILILDNVLIDAELMKQALRKGDVDFVAKRVDRGDTFAEMLETFKPDVVLADSALSDFALRDALDHVRRTHPEVPVIMITNAIDETAVVDAVNDGAKDHVLKDDLLRLPAAVGRAISVAQGIRTRKRAETALAASDAIGKTFEPR